jgi:polysaccharide biosynthesis protein PslH
VNLVGYVPNIHDYLRRSAVAIAPMRAGSGIQNKVLEAMATGTPVVATPYGIGGLDAEQTKHLLIAANAEEFAQSVIRLFKDKKLFKEIALNARKLVEKHFSWEYSANQLENVYKAAMKKN